MATDKVNLPPGFELDQVQKNLPQGFQLDNNVNIKKAEPIKQEPSLGSKLADVATNTIQGLAKGGIPSSALGAIKNITPRDVIESEALPIAGGIAGGTLGATAGYLGTGGLASGALATGGAALGGAAGEAFRQLGARGLKKLGQDVNVPETATEAAKKIGREGLTQGTVALAGEIASPAVRYVAGKVIPNSAEVANEFINSPTAIAISRLESKPSKLPVGEEIISKPENKAFITDNKKKLYNTLNDKIEELGNQAKKIINDLYKKGITPETPNVEQTGKYLEYNPSTVQKIEPSQGVSQPIATPYTITEEVPLRAAAKPAYAKKPDELGVPVTQEYLKPEEAKTGLYPPTEWGGFTRDVQVGSKVEGDVLSPKERFMDAVRKLNEKQQYPFTGIKKEPAIYKSELGERSNVVDNIINMMEKNADKWDITGKDLNLLRKVKNNDAIDFKTSNDLREFLGDYIGKRFMSQEVPEKMSSIIQLWTNLRNRIGEISPELSSILNRQHNLFDFRNSISNEVAKGFSPKQKTLMEAIGIKPTGLTGARNLRWAEQNVYPKLEPIRRTVGAASAEALNSIFGDNK